ncbi:hypothetical protein E3N88_15583 [Mikania micrantha]|uniref:Uncharacterized protein n=1 Tax=Mikania micrantha TaxID=192012 RepID=A0A5N6NY28_9ASTR|nr:hypothetical protein E3N88_15583 [Mikania micrantha]
MYVMLLQTLGYWVTYFLDGSPDDIGAFEPEDVAIFWFLNLLTVVRLDETASILDLGVGCRDLERLSIINRCDKFHGRGQADGEAASLSSDADAPKPFPHRYVVALPLPKSFPERILEKYKVWGLRAKFEIEKLAN